MTYWVDENRRKYCRIDVPDKEAVYFIRGV